MSSISFFPQEIIDVIIDLLRDDKMALKTCCLLSKRWVPYAQKHLFTSRTITFKSFKGAAFWRERFPDPAEPPACYISTLRFFCTESITSEHFSWIQSFPAVIKLHLRTKCYARNHTHGSNNLAALSNLPKAKSLEIKWDSFTAQEIFDFICSFPLLEDLNLWRDPFSQDGGIGAVSRLSALPPLTGTLALSRTGDFMRQMAELPIDLRFRKIETSLCESRVITKLVKRSSATLECININFAGVSGKSCTFAPTKASVSNVISVYNRFG